MAAVALVNRQFEWNYNATLTLIQLRRYYHDQFEYVANNQHRQIWNMISLQLQQINGFVATPEQCRNKWYALKYGYENIRRMEGGRNPHNQPISNPTLHDRLFYSALSDEFWTRTGN